MAQIVIPQAEWEGLPVKVQAARKLWTNGVFLNEPALINGNYVWDDHRVTADHQFILDECKSQKSTTDSAAVVVAKLEQKLYDRLNSVKSAAVVSMDVADQPLTERPKNA